MRQGIHDIMGDSPTIGLEILRHELHVLGLLESVPLTHTVAYLAVSSHRILVVRVQHLKDLAEPKVGNCACVAQKGN